MDNQKNVFIDFCLETRKMEEVAEKMFSLCDVNGVLYIPEFYDGTGTDYELNFQRLELKWNRKDLKKIIKECNKIASAIKEIVCYFGRTDVLKVEKEKAKSVLPKKSVDVLEKYLIPDYKTVTDKNLYFILFYAQKAYRGLRTSEAVCYEDINLFLQAMIVSKFAKTVEKVDSSDFNITKSLRDKGYVINAIGQGAIGGAFKYAAKELRADKDVVFAAVTKYGYNLRYAADELKNDKAFILDAIKASCWTLRYVKDEFKADKEIVLAAVRRDGLALEYTSEDLKADKEVVFEALKRGLPDIIMQYVSPELKKDPDVLNACRR